MTTDDLFAAALSLPPAQREELVARLDESLRPPPSPEVEDAWVDEVNARVRAMDEGRATSVPADEVLEKLRSSWSSKR